MTINAPAALLLLLYQLVGEEQGVDPAQLDRHDPERRAEGVHRAGHLHLPAEAVAAADLATSSPTATRRSRAGTPSPSPATTWPRPGRRRRRRSRSPWPTRASTCGRRWRPGWRSTTSRPRLSFFFVARTTLLEEVAKFRAARRIWAQVMREEFGAQDPKSLMLRFHTQTAGVQLTAQQPEVNMVRVTVQALAAVLGGTQSLHTNSYDEAIALPTEKAARLALRTQQVIAYESDLTATVDPFAGSYAVEAMTDEHRGGDPRADGDGRGAAAARSPRSRPGYQKREIEKSAYDVVRSVEDGSRTVVGVNRFAREADEDLRAAAGRPDDRGPAGRPAGDRLRAERDDAEVDRHLDGPAGSGRAGPTTCSTRCTTRCGPGPPSARSATCCARSGASTTPPTPSEPRPRTPATRALAYPWRSDVGRAPWLSDPGISRRAAVRSRR